MDIARIAKFERISFKQFQKDFGKVLRLNPLRESDFKQLRTIYENIDLPKRATNGSAGYDFFLPYNISSSFITPVLIPTGIKCQISEGWVLQMYPRSSYGIKYGIGLSNTVGIIDSDYYNNEDNEGHIFMELVTDRVHNTGKCEFSAHDRICQGLFVPYGITTDDETNDVRKGGIGSTNKGVYRR